VLRQPTIEKFQNNLESLCDHVLECAKASSKKTSLTEISKQVKKMVTEMRKETNAKLEKIKPILKQKSLVQTRVEFHSSKRSLRWKSTREREQLKIKYIKTLQKQIAQSYTQIMSFISQSCINIMGAPPCKYAIVGMGSLARNEITPYSDFEHIIVLSSGDNYSGRLDSQFK